MGRSQGFLARQFHAASRNPAFVYIRKKLVALGLALPMLALSPAFANQAAADMPAPSPEGLTTHSRSVDDLNRRFGKAGPHNRILFIDRDDVTRRMAQMPRGVSRDVALQKAVEDHVLERIGVRLPDEASETIGQGIASGGGQALAITFRDASGLQSLCTVTGQNPDLSTQAYQQRIMGLIAGVHDDFRNRPMLRQLSPEISAKFTDYHELGHCMDDRHIAQFLQDPFAIHDTDSAVNITHRAEAFAEVFAVLMLARDGHRDVAGIRADHRLVAIATNGYIATQRVGWDNFLKYTGFIYALHEALWEAQREIDRLGPEHLDTMSPQDIAALAHRITERNPLQNPGADHAVTFLLNNGFSLDLWENLRHEFPHIEERYQMAITVRDHIAQAFVRVFGADVFSPDRPGHAQLARDIPAGFFLRNTQDGNLMRAEAISRISASLRNGPAYHDDPEMRIVLNAARERENLRRKLDDTTLSRDVREQAMADLAVMPDAMRMAIIALRQERGSAPSMDNHVRLINPLSPGTAPG